MLFSTGAGEQDRDMMASAAQRRAALRNHLLRNGLLPSHDATEEERTAQFGLLRGLYRNMGLDSTASRSRSRSEADSSSSSDSGDGESDDRSMSDDSFEALMQMQEEERQAMSGSEGSQSDGDGSGMSDSAASEAASDEDADADASDNEDEDDDLDPFEAWHIVYVPTSNLIGAWHNQLLDVQFTLPGSARDAVGNDLMHLSWGTLRFPCCPFCVLHQLGLHVGQETDKSVCCAFHCSGFPGVRQARPAHLCYCMQV